MPFDQYIVFHFQLCISASVKPDGIHLNLKIIINLDKIINIIIYIIHGPILKKILENVFLHDMIKITIFFHDVVILQTNPFFPSEQTIIVLDYSKYQGL